MEEEQMEWHRRMLALAGVDPDADPDDSDRSNGGVDVDAMTYEELTALGETIGTQSKGLDPRILERLPTERVKNDANASRRAPGGGDERNACHREECAVCRMPYEDGEVTTRLPDCGHAFHSECLAPWLEDNKECPMCKTEITLAAGDEGARGRTER
jgi:E3 ubiquitin-protein ligase BIG BROTHER-like protein